MKNYCSFFVSASTEELVLDMAISTLINFYSSAILEEYEPDKNWLIPNDCYND